MGTFTNCMSEEDPLVIADEPGRDNGESGLLTLYLLVHQDTYVLQHSKSKDINCTAANTEQEFLIAGQQCQLIHPTPTSGKYAGQVSMLESFHSGIPIPSSRPPLPSSFF